ncbi:MAG: hypothetical protein GX149_05105 [Acholeplasmataceae bacterium]|jgi:NAD+ kinase|nr:hypothetical protein [Acholeplasmataceae bacterium]
MRYSFVCKKSAESEKIKAQIIEKIKGSYDQKNPKVVFSIGGDGTVLDAVRKYLQIIDDIYIVAINTGSLGFYTEFLPENVDELINTLTEKKTFNSYPLLEIEANGEKEYALNEVTLSVHHHLFKGSVFIDEIFLMDVRANGICISTPSGSTAYNKSIGGAIMDTSVKAFQLALIAPFQTANQKMISPIVLSLGQEITIVPQNKYLDLTFDRVFISSENIAEIKVRLTNKTVKFLKNKGIKFAKRVNEKFIGKE